MVFNWDYLNTAAVVGQPASTWKVYIPSNATLGGFYYQAINKHAPHPAAARLWEEYLFSQTADRRAEPLAARVAPGPLSRSR